MSIAFDLNSSMVTLIAEWPCTGSLNTGGHYQELRRAFEQDKNYREAAYKGYGLLDFGKITSFCEDCRTCCLRDIAGCTAHFIQGLTLTAPQGTIRSQRKRLKQLGAGPPDNIELYIYLATVNLPLEERLVRGGEKDYISG